MAKDFNINDFLGGGSSSNFGNFGGASTPADLFNPNASNNPADAFDFENNYLNSRGTGGFSDQYVDNVYGMENIRLADNLAGGTLAALQQYGGTSFGSPNYGSANFSALETAINASKDLEYQTSSNNINRAILGGTQHYSRDNGFMGSDVGELLGNIRAANQDLVDFQNTLTPRISSEPGPGLEPFNRFNPTISQFEQMFGNQSARLPSAETFIQGETGFNDEPRFLESIRAEAQRNANNFTGLLDSEKLQQAQELGQLMGTGDPAQVMRIGTNANPGNNSVTYGSEFEPRTVEEMNALLKMRTDQQASAQRNADNKYVRGPEFQKAMAEMEKPFLESKAAYDRASLLSQNELKNRLPFNTPFNRDKDGNKFAAGRDADEQSLAQYKKQAAAMYSGKGKSRLKGKDLDNAARALRDADRKAKSERTQRVSEAVETVKNVLGSGNVDYRAMGFDDDAIAQGVKSMGSAQGFINSLYSVMNTLPPKEAKEFGEVTATTLSDISIKTPKQYMIKDTGETTTLGFAPDGSLARVYPDRLDEQGNLVRRGYVDKFDPDQVEVYATGDFRSDQETLSTLRTEIQGEDTAALDKLVEFRDLRAQTSQGIDKVIADIGRSFNTILQKDLTEAQMIEAIASAKFEGLLGSVRLEVLGPGVLTEQDALRLIKSMGGFGFTANKNAALRILDDIIAKKETILGARINKYNDFRTSNLALRNLTDTSGNIRFPEINNAARRSLPNLR